MRTAASSISLTPTETELLLTALAYFEMKFLGERPEHVLDSMRILREKMLGTLRGVNPPASNPDVTS
jgi:hypothetical protein